MPTVIPKQLGPWFQLGFGGGNFQTINFSPLFMLISSFTRVKVNQVYIQIFSTESWIH